MLRYCSTLEQGLCLVGQIYQQLIRTCFLVCFEQPVGREKLGYSRIFLGMLLQRDDSLFKISSFKISLFIDIPITLQITARVTWSG